MAADPNAAEEDVDQLINAFSADVEVSLDYDRQQHPRYGQYKNYGRLVENQRTRRDEWMEKQRRNREAKLNVSRGLDGGGEQSVETPSAEMPEEAPATEAAVEDVEMEAGGIQWGKKQQRSRRRPKSGSQNSWHKAFNQPSRFTRPELVGRLMYSEWLIDVPSDFDTNWVMIPAPKGKRALVILQNYEAEVYNKLGERRDRFGCPSVGKSPVFLDAITTSPHAKNGKKIFVIDLVESDLCESDASDFEYRRFMLQTYIEKGDLLTAPNAGGVSFELLPVIPCSKEAMAEFMSEPAEYSLDGLMFYHKEAFYTGGETPMVGWLKPWMMTDVLEVPVHTIYEKKNKHGTQQDFIDKFAKDHPSYAKPLRRHQPSDSVEQKDAEAAGAEESARKVEEMQ